MSVFGGELGSETILKDTHEPHNVREEHLDPHGVMSQNDLSVCLELCEYLLTSLLDDIILTAWLIG
jgi:hypothetical protein